jgi:hypothetical protein
VVGNAPFQPPEAAQAVALVELQVSVDVPPGPTTVGLAVKLAVGAAWTVTVAVAAALVPPGPVQVSEYDVVAVRAPVLWLLLAGSAPLQPPEAAQAVALVELQVKVDVPPGATTVGLAVKVAVGAAGAVTVTVAVAAALVPPGPVQVSEYDVVAERAPVLWLLLAGNAPFQPPEAAQAVALVEVQLSVDVPPLAILVGFAVNAAVGAGGGGAVGEVPAPLPQATSSIAPPIAMIGGKCFTT